MTNELLLFILLAVTCPIYVVLIVLLKLRNQLSRIERILSRTINQQPPDDGGI